MPDLKYLPISYTPPPLLYSLMEEEGKAWIDELGWDYSPIRQILASFIKQKLLPGYVAVLDTEAVGYTYFLINRTKGIIGAVYVRSSGHSQMITERLLDLTVAALKDSQQVRRVEAQIMLFHNLNLTEAFKRNGFRHFPRYYLNLDVNSYHREPGSAYKGTIVPWDSAYLSDTTEIVLKSYNNQIDSIICADYRTPAGCEGYLRSLVENPGCGVFMPEASFVALDENTIPCGFIIGCRISDKIGMIPQISVYPSYQNRNLGNILMNSSLERFRSSGFHRISLTVTPENTRAYNWYRRLGFNVGKEFGAFIWEREPETNSDQ
jgi:ribosomal protein S18 acetylase RimI-like enzyme